MKDLKIQDTNQIVIFWGIPWEREPQVHWPAIWKRHQNKHDSTNHRLHFQKSYLNSKHCVEDRLDIIILIFCRWSNWGLGRLNDLPKTQITISGNMGLFQPSSHSVLFIASVFQVSTGKIIMKCESQNCTVIWGISSITLVFYEFFKGKEDICSHL